MAEETKQLRAVVHGLVQGVYFRQNTCTVARDLGVTGWVRNQPDGTVEVLAVGATVQLERLLRYLHRGPSHARVTEVEVDWSPPTARFDNFRVRG